MVSWPGVACTISTTFKDTIVRSNRQQPQYNSSSNCTQVTCAHAQHRAEFGEPCNNSPAPAHHGCCHTASVGCVPSSEAAVPGFMCMLGVCVDQGHSLLDRVARSSATREPASTTAADKQPGVYNGISGTRAAAECVPHTDQGRCGAGQCFNSC